MPDPKTPDPKAPKAAAKSVDLTTLEYPRWVHRFNDKSEVEDLRVNDASEAADAVKDGWSVDVPLTDEQQKAVDKANAPKK